MQKPIIMIMSDSPSIPTGMGVAHKELATRLHNTGKYQIISIGWFHRDGMPWPFPWQLIVLPDRAYGHPKNWPDSSQKDLDSCSLNEVIVKYRPNILITLADTWMTDYVSKLPTRNTFKWMWEFPIDGEPVPKSWVRLVKNADIPIVMTQYAEKVIRDIDPNIYLERIPRGLTHEYFKIPISKEEAKKKCCDAFVGRFIIGCVARFQDRKQLSRGIEAVKKFITKYNRRDALLYLHCDINDPASLQLSKTLVGEDGTIERYGMENYVAYDKRITIDRGVSPTRLNLLYNAFDVHILPTQGEGWGLPLVECMSAGTPCIATAYTSIPELLGGHGGLVRPSTFVTGMYNVERALVDTDHMADLIEEYYRNPEKRMLDGIRSADFVKQFKWDTIIRIWIMHIDKLLSRHSYSLIETGTPELNPGTNINICGAVRENTGWAITTRGLTNGLITVNKDVSITEGGGRDESYIVSDKIKQCMSKPRNSDVDIINHLPDHQSKFLEESKARLKISYFPWELTKFKNEWIDALNRRSDLYLCPSNFIKRIALESGVNRVGVIPLAVDGDIDINAKPIKISDNKYHFLCVGQFGDSRKNLKELLKAFLCSFTKSQGVALVIKANPGHEGSDPTELVEFESLGIKDPPEVIVIHEELTNTQMSSLYNSVDCLVHVSHAEGWGQPILEAMKFGLPVIAPAYGGYMDFAANYIIPINFTMGNARRSDVYIPESQWCYPDFNDLSDKMRKAFETNRTRDGIDHAPSFTWERTAKEIDKHIRAINKPEKKIKVYFETGIHSLWNMDNEINIKRYAPHNIVFTDDYTDADVQILNITRLADKFLIKNKNYVALFHTYGEWAEEKHSDYYDIFKKAKLVYSHLDLSEHADINFMRGPWGVDTNIFYNLNPNGKRPFLVSCTGSVAQTEAISELLTASKAVNEQMCHVGPRLFEDSNYFCSGFVEHQKLLELYASSKFMSGLRRIEGFEKTVSEGILCGARPICFDNPIYRHWYGDLVEYVKEGTPEETTNSLIEVFNRPLRRVTEEEMQMVRSKFGWIIVARQFWKRFLEDYKKWSVS